MDPTNMQTHVHCAPYKLTAFWKNDETKASIFFSICKTINLNHSLFIVKLRLPQNMGLPLKKMGLPLNNIRLPLKNFMKIKGSPQRIPYLIFFLILPLKKSSIFITYPCRIFISK